jgi:hypothetical protein
LLLSQTAHHRQGMMGQLRDWVRLASIGRRPCLFFRVLTRNVMKEHLQCLQIDHWPSYPVYGGLFEKEAIMLLRRFYIQENEKGRNEDWVRLASIGRRPCLFFRVLTRNVMKEHLQCLQIVGCLRKKQSCCSVVSTYRRTKKVGMRTHKLQP